MVRSARVLVSGAALLLAFGATGCGGPPPPKAPPAPDLDIKPIPAKLVPQPAPAPFARTETAPTSGSCGDPKEGSPAPPLSLVMPAGGQYTLAKGNVTLVYFWATWCNPCQRAFPKYQAMYAKLKARGFDMVAVSVDDESSGVPAFAKQYGGRFPIAWDGSHDTANCWRVNTMPMVYVIDRDGVVQHAHGGYNPGDEATLEREIEALL